MAIDTPSALIDLLRRDQLLDAEQLDELARAPAAASAKLLAGELLQRGWLTPFQVNQVLQDRAADLLLGPYVLLERLGEGGMGAVFKARHRKLGRIVALKVIRKERLADADAVKRFQREVHAAAQMAHANVVHALDADQVGDRHLLVMEYVEGIDLAHLVKERGPLPVEQACDYVRQAALGLQHAHERGLVHRDIKPSNLLLAKSGQVKLLDLGLARLTAAAGESNSTLTQEGSVMGTPDYVAPEQARQSHTVDIRADLYSLGCTLYFLLAGRPPFPGGTLGEKLLHHMLDEPEPVETLRPEVPPGVAAIIRRLMTKAPGQRYQTPGELAAVLDAGLKSGNWPGPAQAVQTAVPVAMPVLDSCQGTGDEPTLATADASNPFRAPAPSRGWLLPAAVAALLVLLLPVALVMLWLVQRPGDVAPPKPALPRGETLQVVADEETVWIDSVAKLPPPKQMDAVVARLKKRNPGYDGWNQPQIVDNAVVELVLCTDQLTDLSPLRALKHLWKLHCDGNITPTGTRQGKLTSLAALRGLELRELSCVNNPGITDLSPLKRMPLGSLDCTGTGIRDLEVVSFLQLRRLSCDYTKVRDLGPLKGSALTYLNCSATAVSSLEPLRGVPLNQLHAPSTAISDLSPLAGMPLHVLNCSRSKVTDLTPLKDLPLTMLECSENEVKDLVPLTGMKLTLFTCYTTPVADLNPLRGMPLTTLHCSMTQVADLSPLRGMPLTVLGCRFTPVADLTPLAGMPLAVLICSHTKVKDLSPLRGMPVEMLHCEATAIADLAPLKELPRLRDLVCDFQPRRDAEVLRGLKSLQTINSQPVAEFWKKVEADNKP